MFKCSLCGAGFNRRDNLKRHLMGAEGLSEQEAEKLLPNPKQAERKQSPKIAKLQDKKVSSKRVIRLNRVYLEPNGKGYAELVPLGDIHYGHPACDVDRATRMRDYCLEKGVYVLGMGDYIEAGLRTSVGDSVYQQELNPDSQTEWAEEFFAPLAERGLLIGLLLGNHEGRILKETSINVVRWMAKQLQVPYLGYACWNLLYVGNQSYSVYALHGSTGSRYVYTKLKALVDISHNFDADLLMMGHVHELDENAILVQRVDRSSKTIKERKKYLLLTGSYLQYDDSYAQEKGYPMGKLGSPKVKLFSDKHDIHLST